MKNMTEAQCDNPTNETKKMVLNLSQTHFNPIFLPRSVKRRQACWRIFCCWKMSDRSYFASWLDPFQTGGIASLLLLTLWQICADTLFLNLFCAQVWPETTTFTLLLGNESDLCWIWSSCYHRSHTQVSHSFKVLATLSISLRLPSFYYMLPSLGISLGGQFFVFFQVFLIGCCDSGQNLWESADKSFPINVRCSLPTRATTQTASKKAIESLQGGTLCNLQNSRILCK